MMEAYAVVGRVRSGTTALCRALAAGGIEWLHSDSRNNSLLVDYKAPVPPGGFYELSPTDMDQYTTAESVAGKGMKVMAFELGLRPPVIEGISWRIIFTSRPLEEIQKSVQTAWLGTVRFQASPEGPAMKTDDAVRATLNNRKDVAELVSITHQDLVDRPDWVADQLTDWPIDRQAFLDSLASTRDLIRTPDTLPETPVSAPQADQSAPTEPVPVVPVPVGAYPPFVPPVVPDTLPLSKQGEEDGTVTPPDA